MRWSKNRFHGLTDSSEAHEGVVPDKRLGPAQAARATSKATWSFWKGCFERILEGMNFKQCRVEYNAEAR
jgi:hypothetical protein